ncbi:MAG: hypothetical protein IJY24_02595 [Clostridia bacterium]|nr:hypothetical protein [Clostridia bacterium]
MSDSPDISKVVSMLMQNPEIIASIGAMLSKGKTDEPSKEEPKEDVEISVTPSEPNVRRKSNRAALLGALKPYLRESRAGAIDSMISILDVLEIMRR